MPKAGEVGLASVWVRSFLPRVAKANLAGPCLWSVARISDWLEVEDEGKTKKKGHKRIKKEKRQVKNKKIN